MSEDLLPNGEWKNWQGAPCAPCSGLVEVMYLDGEIDTGEASFFRWDKIGSESDIIAWRPRFFHSTDSVDLDSALDIQVGGEHYKKHVIQPVEFITKNKLGFLEGCVIKRICRYEDKNGREDLEKAKHEIDLLIELKYGSQA